jgi:hypothetical protein
MEIEIIKAMSVISWKKGIQSAGTQ